MASVETGVENINCGGPCNASWRVKTLTLDGRRVYFRDDLKRIAPAMARHMREFHGDEAAALRAEAWAVSPDPGTAPPSPE